jgi:hypothetical protein
LFNSSSSLLDVLTVNLVDILTRTTHPISASNFYLHSDKDISLLKVETLDGLISNDSLRVENDDALLRQLLELGPRCSSLIHHIRFEFLSSEGIIYFVQYFRYFDLTELIWESICVRLEGIYESSVQLKRLVCPSCPLSASNASSVPHLDSQILSAFPSLFSEFRCKIFHL